MTETLFDICRNNHGGDPQSEAANRRTNKERDKARIWDFIKSMGDHGATCYEVQQALSMRPQTASARMSDMRIRDRSIDRNGEKRKTDTGCWSAVCVVTE